jgi:hypothetical protein
MEILDAPKIPTIEGLQIQYLGQSTQFSSVRRNNTMTTIQERLFNFQIIPTQTGTFHLPAIEVKTSGGNQETVARTLTVTAGQNGQEQIRLADYLQLEAQIVSPHPYVYLHQEVTLLVTLYWRQLDVRISEYPSIPREDIIIKNHADVNPNNPNFEGYAHDPGQTVTRDGQEWQRWTFRTHFYPISAGNLTLTPITINVPIKVNRSRRSLNSWDPFGDFFGSSTETFAISAKPLDIEVRPIPAESRPDSFQGATGQFEVTHEIQPVKLQAGDPLALTVHVTGAGNFATVQAPEFPEVEQFRVYEPTTTDVTRDLPATARGKNLQPPVIGKDFEFVAVPLEAGDIEFPAVEFSFFDPVAERFETIPIGPFPLEVTPAPEGSQKAVLQTLKSPVSPQQTRRDRDIVFIKTDREPASGNSPLASLPAWAYAVHSIPVVLLLMSFVSQTLLRKQKQDSRKIRQARAPKVAREALSKAQNALDKQDSSLFFQAVHQALQQYFGHLLGRPTAGITVDIVLPELQAMGVDEKDRDSVEQLFFACDHARFGSGQVPPAEMADILTRCRQTLDRVHKFQKSGRIR